MAYDFPNAPAIGQVANGYVWDGEKWKASNSTGPVLATKKNYIINGAMMVSQENGATAGTTSGYYPVDMSALLYNNSGTQTAQQVASATPAGSPNRLRITATAADASVAAGDYCRIQHNIEGLRSADLRIGSSAAKAITLQFGVKAPAGTYCVAFFNAAFNRTYVAEYVISAGEANTDVMKSVTVTLDQTGTWAVDNSTGLNIVWCLMAGSTWQTTANAWAAGLFFGTSSQFNFMGTASNVFELFDVSLTEGTVAPPFQVPDYADELALCQRYFWLWSGTSGQRISVVYCDTTTSAHAILPLSCTLRAIPTVTFSGSLIVSPGTAPTVSFIIGPLGSPATLHVVLAGTGFIVGPATLGAAGGTGTIKVSARL